MLIRYILKTLKKFLNEAANSIKSLGASGWATKLVGKGGYNNEDGSWYFKKTRELFKKSKQSKDDKINGQYKDINNPKKPSEIDLIKGTIPVKKA